VEEEGGKEREWVERKGRRGMGERMGGEEGEGGKERNGGEDGWRGRRGREGEGRRGKERTYDKL
jgi:hypothetical protein